MSFDWDYKDPYWAGRMNDILPHFQTPLYLFRITGKVMGADGSITEMKKRYTIQGSLQVWRKRFTYTDDAGNTTARDGKLLVDYRIKINEGDIIQKQNTFFRVVGEANDYDYAEVHDYAVTRIGLDEIKEYKFDEFLEEEFPDLNTEGSDGFVEI